MCCQVGERDVANIQFREFTLDNFTSVSLVLASVTLPKPVSYFRAAARGSQVTQLRAEPVAARLRFLTSYDFDLVAVLYFVRQRHYAPVDLGTTATMADHRMHVIREVQRRCLGRHFDDVTFRADGIDTVFEYILANLVKKIPILVRGFEQLSQKPNLLIERALRHSAFLVSPVCSDAEFGVPMHVVCTNLDLDCLAVRTNDGRVQ